MSHPFALRISQIQKKLTDRQVILVTSSTDIKYFTGFITDATSERDAYLLITTDSALLLHSPLAVASVVAGLKTTAEISLSELTSALKELKKDEKNHLLIDEKSLYAYEFRQLEKILGIKLENLDKSLIWQLRMIKDAAEIESITRACQLTAQAYEYASTLLTPGITEATIASEISIFLQRHSAHLAFPTIVAFGEHSAIPHHTVGDKKLEKEMVVLIDLGASVGGYCGDMTRTLWFGTNPSAQFLKIETIVQQAYQAGLAVAKQTTERTASRLDLATRAVIENAGYGKNYIHTTGHGLGLDIHEPPTLYKTSSTQLEAGMAITIEPGVYLDGLYGYRHENTLIVTSETATELTLPPSPDAG